jgi:hypothetical protein
MDEERNRKERLHLRESLCMTPFIFHRHENKKPSLQKKDWVSYITLHSLPSKTQREAYSGRFSGLRIVLLLAPSRSLRPVGLASFVPDYSGVAVSDSHGVPFSASSHLNMG